jgi:dihydrofolate synthase/folylpolyglutamate synthase
VRLYESLSHALPWAFGDGPDALTFFELVTLLGFAHFAEQRPDVLVVEVGLGGRLDATNVVQPLVTCLTPIGLDHREFLGTTLAQIAHEKAGILKRGVPAVVAAQTDEAWEAIDAQARRLGVVPALEGRDFSLRDAPGGLVFTAGTTEIGELALGLRGRHQASNAAVALQALAFAADQGLSVPVEARRRGLARTEWPGRLEAVRTEPEVVLDGAHNAHAAEALAAAVRELFAGRRVHLVLGVLADKELEPMLALLAPIATRVTATAPRSPRALPAGQLADAMRRFHPDVRAIATSREAVERAIGEAARDDVVLVCGSLYLVGEVRAELRGARAGGPSEILR